MIERRGRSGSLDDRVDRFEHRGHAAGIVVRAIVDLSDPATASAAVAAANVVVVSPDEDDLVLEFRVAALPQPEDVAIAGAEFLR